MCRCRQGTFRLTGIPGSVPPRGGYHGLNPDSNKRTQLGAAAWIIEANCQRALNPVPHPFAACEADSQNEGNFGILPICKTTRDPDRGGDWLSIEFHHGEGVYEI
jgi:hypothetical protein